MPQDDTATIVAAAIGQAGREDRSSPARRRAKKVFIARVLFFIGLAGAWQSLSLWPYFGPNLTPGLQRIIPEIIRLAGTPMLWGAMWDTLSYALLALLLGAITGITLGTAVGLIRPVRRSSRLLLEVLRATPLFGLMPIFILLLGTGPVFKLSLPFLGSMWPFLVQTSQGVAKVDSVLIETVRSFRVPKRHVLLRVVLPNALPYMATALRLSLVLSILITVGVEALMKLPGLGAEVALSSQYAAMTEMWAWIFYAAVVGMGATLLVERVEKAMIYWRPSGRSA
ncbi:ABC transporter permease [Microbacterium sp.]|uniref:ABC transporter permease n=1 Tax=Microbacterium sp. TaxID=51671 RepID=UPI003C7737B0